MLKRSMMATVLTLAALVATGCGASPTAGVPFKSTVAKRTTTPSTAASAVAQVGAVALQLSSLKTAESLEVKLTGAGLQAPLVRTLTADELAASNTVSFENLPVGAYSVSLAAFDSTNESLGAKTTSVNVIPNQATKVGLQLSLAAGSLAFTTVDADALTEATDSDESVDDETPAATPTPTPSPSTETGEDTDENGALGIEVVNKETVRKFLLFKKLAVTVKVTNHNATETLSGSVKVDFYTTSGIINKTTKLAETMVQDIKNLAPGKSVELTIQSTKSAIDAEATVNTVVSSATASTAE